MSEWLDCIRAFFLKAALGLQITTFVHHAYFLVDSVLLFENLRHRLQLLDTLKN